MAKFKTQKQGQDSVPLTVPGDDRQPSPLPDLLPESFPPHYLHAIPSPVASIVAILAALMLLALATQAVQNAGSRAILIPALTGDTPAPGTPILTVEADRWALDDQPIHESDLLFKLSAAAGRSPVIIVETAPSLPARRLTHALEMISQAGFTQVGMPNETDSPKPAL